MIAEPDLLTFILLGSTIGMLRKRQSLQAEIDRLETRIQQEKK